MDHSGLGNCQPVDRPAFPLAGKGQQAYSGWGFQSFVLSGLFYFFGADGPVRIAYPFQITDDYGATFVLFFDFNPTQ